MTGCWAGSTGKVSAVRTEPDCIFCGIVDGEVASTTIAQSERAIAFMDINPVTHGHALVAPRSHATDLFDITADDLAACVHLTQQIAGRAKDRLGADGVNLLVCSGEAAWQTVFHFHVHVIPRFNDQPGKDNLAATEGAVQSLRRDRRHPPGCCIGPPWASVPGDLDEIERIGNLLS